MIPPHKIPTTLTDVEGEVYGLLSHEGDIILCPPTNVGKEVVGWNSEATPKPTFYANGEKKPVSEWTRKEVVGVVVWDGAAPSKMGKGDLMGDYGSAQRVHRQFGGPRFKVATYGHMFEEVNPMEEETASAVV